MTKAGLHNKYRPKSLKRFIGNETVVKKLQSFLDRPKTMPHVLLFQGTKGCGKTTLARIMASAVGCAESDRQDINTGNNRGIETARELISKARMKPMFGPVKVYILDEVHKATNEFQNAMLTLLEEPPGHVYFFLCTTDPHKLLKTVRDRCSTFEVKILGHQQLDKLLRRVLKREGKKLPENVREQLIEAAEGGPRRLLVLLDQVIDLPSSEVSNIIAIEEEQREQSIELARALLAGKKWKSVAKILLNLEEDEEGIRLMMLSYMNKVLLGNSSALHRAAIIIENFEEPFYNSGKPGLSLACYKCTIEGA